MLFKYQVQGSVSKTEFYPEPFYEEVYPENLTFSIPAENQPEADDKAVGFLLNKQYELDNEYFDLLDKNNLQYRKREEIIERRPFLLSHLRRYGEDKAFISEKKLNDLMQLNELPKKPEVTEIQTDQIPSSLHYRFFRNLTTHQFAYGLLFLAVVILMILFLPQFRELGAFEIIRFN